MGRDYFHSKLRKTKHRPLAFWFGNLCRSKKNTSSNNRLRPQQEMINVFQEILFNKLITTDDSQLRTILGGGFIFVFSPPQNAGNSIQFDIFFSQMGLGLVQPPN